VARILVIDDVVAQAFLRTFLQREGHEVLAAQTGSEGLRLFRTNAVDLILTTVSNIYGLEALAQLRTEFPQAKLIGMLPPGGTEEDFRPVVQSLRAQRTLTKPFKRKELLETVSALLGANQ